MEYIVYAFRQKLLPSLLGGVRWSRILEIGWLAQIALLKIDVGIDILILVMTASKLNGCRWRSVRGESNSSQELSLAIQEFR